MSETQDLQRQRWDPGVAGALAARIRQTGQRVTPQRLAILRALEQGQHLSAEEVFAAVGAHLPAVTRSTVYRTLEAFRDAGIVSETDLGQGVRKFEVLGASRHHHLICHVCGTMTELDDALVQPLRAEIAVRYRFAAPIEHLALFGSCAACSRRAD